MPDRMTHFSTVCNYDFYFSKGHFNLLLEFVNSFALLIKVTTLRKKGFGKEVGQSKTRRTKKKVLLKVFQVLFLLMCILSGF